MNTSKIKVLAVADPAVKVYADKKINLLGGFKKEVRLDIVPWAQYYETLGQVFAGKAFYDVIMVAGHLWLRDFAQKGYLEPLELEEEDILPAVLEEMNYGGKTYLSPSFCDGHMIVYRKRMLQERLGSLFPEIITPKEYILAAEKIGSSKDMAAVAMKAHPSEIFTDALPFLRMYGADVYDKDTLEPVCDRKEIILGLEKYCELKSFAPADTDTYGNEEIAKSLQKKKAAMAVTWSGQLRTVWNEECADREDLGFASFDTAWNVTWSFAVSANSREKEGAKELLRFLRSPKADKIAGEYSGAPVRKKSYLEGTDRFPWYSCQLSMIERAKPIPGIRAAGDKNGVLYEEIGYAFTGKKTPAKAMEDGKERIRKMDL